MSPSSTSSVMQPTLKTFLDAHPSIKYIRFVIHDYANVPRCILTTVSRALSMAGDGTDSSAITTMTSIHYTMWNSTPALDVAMMIRLPDVWVPDWETVKPTTRAEQGVVICNVKEQIESPMTCFDRDPRTVLKRIVDRAKGEFDLEFKVGHEIEFLLIDSIQATDVISSPAAPYALSVVREPSFDVTLEAVDALENAGVKVWNFHAELGNGHFEISLGPEDPMTAVDNMIHAHDVIRSIAKEHGMHATMHPQPFEGGSRCGLHVHISLNKTELSDPFLAGFLAHLRGITAVLMGGFDSYGTRVGSYGTGDVAWGQGKNAPIRRIGSSRFEIRPPDNLGNPYLQIASIIGVGLDGIRTGMKLEMKENQESELSPLNEKTKRDLGVTETMPGSLIEAVEAMEKDTKVVREVMGERCFESFLQHRKEEIKHTKASTREERRTAIVAHI